MELLIIAPFIVIGLGFLPLLLEKLGIEINTTQFLSLTDENGNAKKISHQQFETLVEKHSAEKWNCKYDTYEKSFIIRAHKKQCFNLFKVKPNPESETLDVSPKMNRVENREIPTEVLTLLKPFRRVKISPNEIQIFMDRKSQVADIAALAQCLLIPRQDFVEITLERSQKYIGLNLLEKDPTFRDECLPLLHKFLALKNSEEQLRAATLCARGGHPFLEVLLQSIGSQGISRSALENSGGLAMWENVFYHLSRTQLEENLFHEILHAVCSNAPLMLAGPLLLKASKLAPITSGSEFQENLMPALLNTRPKGLAKHLASFLDFKDTAFHDLALRNLELLGDPDAARYLRAYSDSPDLASRIKEILNRMEQQSRRQQNLQGGLSLTQDSLAGGMSLKSEP